MIALRIVVSEVSARTDSTRLTGASYPSIADIILQIGDSTIGPLLCLSYALLQSFVIHVDMSHGFLFLATGYTVELLKETLVI